MAFLLADALQLLQEWSTGNANVSLAFVGRGLVCEYASGRISDVSGNVVTFSSPGVRVTFDTGINTDAQLAVIPQSSMDLPQAVRNFVDSKSDCVLVLYGGQDKSDILSILHDRNSPRTN